MTAIDLSGIDVAKLSVAEQRELLALLEEQELRRRRNFLASLFPDEGPLRRELYQRHLLFFRLGGTHKTRSMISANRVGKTTGAGYETACHLTGRYPEWWDGYRFDGPIDSWVAGDTKETVRDIIQAKMLGPENEIGTGLIPADCIGKPMYRPNSNRAVDYVAIKHSSGGWSRLGFKSYDQGREAFQGTEKHLVWLDEESNPNIRSEAVLRLMTTGGLLLETFTPLRGATEIVRSYMPEEADLTAGCILQDDRAMVMAGWDDVPHLSEEEKKRMLSETPAHMREARSKGIPALGSGAVFPVPEELIKIPRFEIPDAWPRIIGLDFGWNHPTAAIDLAWDRDRDCVYVIACYRVAEQPVIVHAHAIKAWGDWIPVAWPHDGLQHDKGSGETLANQYRAAGLPQMLENHATHEDGGYGFEAGVLEMLDRMVTSRFRVFSDIDMWFGEYRLYHRDEKGLVVKVRDDLMSASRIAVMMLREAKVKPLPRELVGRSWGRRSGPALRSGY